MQTCCLIKHCHQTPMSLTPEPLFSARVLRGTTRPHFWLLSLHICKQRNIALVILRKNSYEGLSLQLVGDCVSSGIGGTMVDTASKCVTPIFKPNVVAGATLKQRHGHSSAQEWPKEMLADVAWKHQPSVTTFLNPCVWLHWWTNVHEVLSENRMPVHHHTAPSGCSWLMLSFDLSPRS